MPCGRPLQHVRLGPAGPPSVHWAQMAAAVALVFAGLALGGLAYSVLALLGARSFVRTVRSRAPDPAALPAAADLSPPVSLLKPLKGVDARLLDALRSHCRQNYAGAWEILFGVGSSDDPAVVEVERLRAEFPETPLTLVVAATRVGASGKVNALAAMEPRARYPLLLVNDSDIHVGPDYLARILRGFADPRVGMVTALYRGQALADARGRVPLWSRLEALSISTDFAPGVLTARLLEGGIRFGLGSTLAMRRDALRAAGGFAAVADALADDYELGRRIAMTGARVELAGEVVETTVPAYSRGAFWQHQMRWARTVRDSRKGGYIGLSITYALPWALAACISSGFALWSLALLSLVLAARVAVALGIGMGVLHDRQVLRDLWLLPLRDCVALLVWLWSFAGDEIVWRGERFRLHDGKLEPLTPPRQS